MSVYGAYSSVGGFGNLASPKPSVDAWCVFELNSGSNPRILDSVGVSSITRLQNGVFRVTFSDATRFSSGAYVALTQPETGASTEYWVPISQGSITSSGATASGLSASTDISLINLAGNNSSFSVPSGFSDSIASTKTRINAAFICMRSDSDLGKPHVANLLYNSGQFDNITPLGWGSTYVTTPGFYGAVDPSVAASPVAGASAFYIDGYPTLNYIAQGAGSVNTLHTFSVYFKSVTGVTAQILCGGGGNNFGYQYNLSSGTLTEVNTFPSGGSRSGSIVDAGNGWKRCILTFSTPNSPAPLINTPPSGTRLYMAAAQLEYGSVASQYIGTTNTRPVYGNQDSLITLYPSTRGFGASGATYSSAIAQISNKRAATAWGTLVIAPNKNSNTATAYLEDSYNIQGVSSGNQTVFDVYFNKEMGNTGYCVVTSTEQENVFPETGSVGGANMIPPTYEYTINMLRHPSGSVGSTVQENHRKTTGFTVTSIRQIPAANYTTVDTTPGVTYAGDATYKTLYTHTTTTSFPSIFLTWDSRITTGSYWYKLRVQRTRGASTTTLYDTFYTGLYDSKYSHTGRDVHQLHEMRADITDNIVGDVYTISGVASNADGMVLQAGGTSQNLEIKNFTAWTKNGQMSTNNSYAHYNNGLTQKIHFMVFGGLSAYGTS